MKKSKSYFKNLIKGDLHLHLSGALSPKNIRVLAKELSVTFNDLEPLEKHMDYFDPLIWGAIKRITANPRGLALAVKSILLDQKKENIARTEITINFHDLIRRGIDIHESIQQLRKVIIDEYPSHGIKCKIKVGILRRYGPRIIEEATKIYQLSKELFWGLDLNGDERATPIELFNEELKKAKVKAIPFTIHAGESLNLMDSLEKSLALRPTRITHGIAAINNERILCQIIDQNIPLEICPVSNIKTGAIKNFKKHPVKELIKTGVPLVLCTDDPALFHTSLTDQYQQLNQVGISKEDLSNIARRSLTLP